MVMDALRGYLQLASGLTEVTRERARAAAKALVAQAGSLGDNPGESLGDTSAQVRALADDLARTARANRDLVVSMVRAETERAVGAVGMASTEDVAALRRQVERLERRVLQLAPAAAAPIKSAPAKTASTRTPARADKAATTKATVTKAVAKNASAKRAAATKVTASRSTASKAGPAKRSTATKTTAPKKTAPKKTAPKKRTATP
jgi:polyhydroxyalkanoate synthesis regulator phasin